MRIASAIIVPSPSSHLSLSVSFSIPMEMRMKINFVMEARSERRISDEFPVAISLRFRAHAEMEEDTSQNALSGVVEARDFTKYLNILLNYDNERGICIN